MMWWITEIIIVQPWLYFLSPPRRGQSRVPSAYQRSRGLWLYQRQSYWCKSIAILIAFFLLYTVEPLYNEVLGTMKITLLYQVSHYIRVKKQRNIKSWDQQNYLVIRGLCYIRPRYNEVPLYINISCRETRFFLCYFTCQYCLGHNYMYMVMSKTYSEIDWIC